MKNDEKLMVTYEFNGVRDSKRAKTELADLILRGIVRFQDSFTLGGVWDILLKIQPKDLDEVVEKLKPWKALYRSPTYFCWSSICPIYESPEAQFSDSPCKEYIAHTEGKCRCKR